MPHYTVGLVLSFDRARVLLLEKQKPDHHKGMFNGIGGKIEEGEMPLQCIVRECREETGLEITRWHLIERGLADDGNDLFTYTTFCPPNQTVKTGDCGLAEWFNINELPDASLCDIPRLVQLAVKQAGFLTN